MNIYVGNLSDDVTKTDLKNAFKVYGKVTSIQFKKDLFTKKTKGYAFIVMLSTAEAEAAIKGLNGTELKGRILKVSETRSETQSWKKSGKRTGRPF
jgi:RNA recognition motif-containing protein